MQGLGDVEETEPLHPHHPLVPAAREKVDGQIRHVEPERADTLDRIDAEQHAAFVAERADGFNLRAEAGQELHPTHAHEPRLGRQRPLHVLDGERPTLVRDEVERDAFVLQSEPRIHVRGKLAGRHGDAVARLPVEPLREHVQRSRRVRRELDALGRRTEQSSDPLPCSLDDGRDIEVVIRLRPVPLVEKGIDGLADGAAERSGGGVVEVGPLVGVGKVLAEVGEGHALNIPTPEAVVAPGVGTPREADAVMVRGRMRAHRWALRRSTRH